MTHYYRVGWIGRLQTDCYLVNFNISMEASRVYILGGKKLFSTNEQLYLLQKNYTYLFYNNFIMIQRKHETSFMGRLMNVFVEYIINIKELD